MSGMLVLCHILCHYVEPTAGVGMERGISQNKRRSTCLLGREFRLGLEFHQAIIDDKGDCEPYKP
jgi:hypothetical protein